MAHGRYVSYLRVSTARQGASGLGLEAQRKAVSDYLNGGAWDVLAEFVEVESGKRADRPMLADALRLCRLHNATLVIAKLDRLSRDVHFLTGLQLARVRFVAADMPDANETMVQFMAVMAQAERKMISDRTKAALTAAKARGTVLGTPANLSLAVAEEGRARGRARKTEIANDRVADLAPVIMDIQAKGAVSLREIATALNERKIPTARGGEWSAVQVSRVLARIPAPAAPQAAPVPLAPRPPRRMGGV